MYPEPAVNAERKWKVAEYSAGNIMPLNAVTTWRGDKCASALQVINRGAGGDEGIVRKAEGVNGGLSDMVHADKAEKL